MVDYLLRIGVDPNMRGFLNGITPLQFAVGRNHVEIARLLLEAHADINAPFPPGTFQGNLLMGSTATGQVEMVRLLLKHGLKPHEASVTDALMPLTLAVQILDSPTLLQLLLDNCDSDFFYISGDVFSSFLMDLAMFRIARINEETKIPGHVSANSLEIIRIILDCDTKLTPLNLPGHRKITLNSAINIGNLALVKLFLQYPVLVDFTTSESFLSSQDQSDINVLKCIQLLTSKHKDVIPKQHIEDVEHFQNKLACLHNFSPELLNLTVSQSAPIIPQAVIRLICAYDNRTFTATSPITFFKPVTVNNSLNHLKYAFIMQNTRQCIGTCI